MDRGATETLNLIKARFLETVILQHTDFKQMYYLNCDASDVSLGIWPGAQPGRQNTSLSVLLLKHITIVNKDRT